MPYDALFLTLTVAALVGRIYLPWAGAPTGALVRREPLPLLARLRLHGGPVAVIFAVALVAVVTGWLSLWSLAIPWVALLVLLCVPVRYTLTTEGIARGRTTLRRWTEFGGVARRPGGARLQGIAGARGMTVWLAGARDADETILLLRQLVRGSYQGHRAQILAEPHTQEPTTAGLDPAPAAGR